MKILWSKLLLLTWILFLAIPTESFAVLDGSCYGVSIYEIKNTLEAIFMDVGVYVHDGYPETSYGSGWIDDSYNDKINGF